jgi:hypothetical protein
MGKAKDVMEPLFLTQVTIVSSNPVEMDPIDAIISKMNMDMENKICHFEKFMMTDPGSANWDESL